MRRIVPYKSRLLLLLSVISLCLCVASFEFFVFGIGISGDLFTPKGWNNKAQGNALGVLSLNSIAPTGRYTVPPLQGSSDYGQRTQGVALGFIAPPLRGEELSSIVPTLRNKELSVLKSSSDTDAAQRGPSVTPEHPLPLAAHWNLGELENGFSPEYQMRMIKEGHHLLPWFRMPNIEWSANDAQWVKYFEAPLREAATRKLPLSLVSSQWESVLTTDPAFFKLPPDQNPNVIGPDGKPRPEVSAFGPISHWREVGKRWGSSPLLQRVQTWYPDPPMLLLVSNNEHARLWWLKAEEDRHYLKLYGRGRSDDFKRRVIGDGWIERYRALQAGIREGLANEQWRKKAIFVGYDAFGPPHFARWPGWMEYSLYSSGRIDPKPLAWDGGSPSYYVFNWNESTDYTVFGPQIESMNWIFMLKEAERLNPRFWFEISTWDGHEPEMENDKRKLYAKRGQKFTPERYGGVVQFGMWLLRPRVVREFRGWRDTLPQAEPFFLPIVAAVDRIHSNPTLRRFWQSSDLVANRARQHPYQVNVPPEYQKEDRWFLLDTNQDPPRPWSLTTEIPVYSIARVSGKSPSRQWLVYAHAPLAARPNVMIKVPDFGEINVHVPVGGGFYLVDEASKRHQVVR